MQTGYFHRVTGLTPTRLWINNVTPIEARLAIEAGAVGCTQNPTYAYKMLMHKEAGAHALALLDAILLKEPDDGRAQAKLQLALVREVADVFLPMYERTRGREGYVTIQANPFENDVDDILAAARRHCAAAPNIMAKIPAIPTGLDAIGTLLREGAPVLATEVMSVSQALACADMYQRARDEVKRLPAMYLAHIPGIFDEYLAGVAAREGAQVPSDYLWQAGVAVAKKIAALLDGGDYAIGRCSGGARGLHHFTELVGGRWCVTINWPGAADALIAENPPVVDRFSGPVPPRAIDALCDALPDFRRAYETRGLAPEAYESFGPVRLFCSNFEDAWTKALALIRDRRRALGL